jgi:hypothetical protein
LHGQMVLSSVNGCTFSCTRRVTRMCM